MTDKLKESIPSPLDLRAKLEDMVRADLLGPAGGPEEIVDERNVREGINCHLPGNPCVGEKEVDPKRCALC